MPPQQRAPLRPPPKVLYPASEREPEPDDAPAPRLLGLAAPRSRWRRYGLPAGMLLVALALIGWALGLFGPGSSRPGGTPLDGFERRGATPPPPAPEFVPPAPPAHAGPGEVAVDDETGLRLEIWSGNGQSGRVGRRLRNVLGVVLRDDAGMPVAGVPIVFRVAAGGGEVGSTEPTTNEDGFASGAWRLGDDPDSLLVSVSVADRPALTVWFRATLQSGPSALALPAPATASGLDSPRAAPAATGPAPAPRPAGPPSAPARTRVAAGGVHTCVLPSDDQPRCWGRAPEGAGAAAARGTSPLATVSSISAGVLDVCVVTIDSAVFCWRAGSPPSTGARADLPANIAAVQVVAGAYHRCALSSYGSVYCWGANTQGQLGNGTTADSDTTLGVPGLPTIATLAGGWLHTCALARTGVAFCWGSNASGQLGGGDVAGMGPMRVATAERMIAISAGSAHTCALTDAGAAICWGANSAGQLGTGGTAAARAPAAVEGGRTFAAISAGGTHTCALDDDGRAWCWGGNAFGQLGDGSVETARTPRAVAGNRRFARIHAGGAHTCAETDAGALWCWGANVQGQLGDGSLGNQTAPVRVEVE
jgi:hypothetical protein